MPITQDPFNVPAPARALLVFDFVLAVALLPLNIILTIFSKKWRPTPVISVNRAVRLLIVRHYLIAYSALRFRQPILLIPTLFGRARRRWVVIDPVSDHVIQNTIADGNGYVKPEKIGGTWYPDVHPHLLSTESPSSPQKAHTSPPTSSSSSPSSSSSSSSSTLSRVANPSVTHDSGPQVLLLFHGGGFVIGHGRDRCSGYKARTIMKHAKIPYTFSPQYRLGYLSNGRGRFPAQLQDALASYLYLLNQVRIPANQIVISGDSAGGNLCLAMLRFISEYGNNLGIPAPLAALLWSPWVDPSNTWDFNSMMAVSGTRTDYLMGSFGGWGIRAVCSPDGQINAHPVGIRTEFASAHSSKIDAHSNIASVSVLDPTSNYISPLYHPFKTETALFVQSGESEILFKDNVRLAFAYGDPKDVIRSAVVIDSDLRLSDCSCHLDMNGWVICRACDYDGRSPHASENSRSTAHDADPDAHTVIKTQITKPTPLAKRFANVANDLELVIVRHAPHDIALLGGILGYHAEFCAAAHEAGKFIRRTIKTHSS